MGENYILQEEVPAALHDDPAVKGTAKLTLESTEFFTLVREVSRQGMKAQACLGTSFTKAPLSLIEAQGESERGERQ